MEEGLVPVRLGKQRMGRSRAAVEVAVGLVDDQRQPVCLGEPVEGHHQIGGVFDATGIVGRDQHDGAGSVGQERLGVGGRGQKLGVGGQRHGLDPGDVEPHLVVEIPRCRQDHRVAGTGQRGDGGGEGLVAAGGDRHLFGRDRTAIDLRNPGGQFGAQIRQAEDRAVEMGGIVVQRRLGDRRAQPRRRRRGGRGLADIEQRPVSRKAHAVEPLFRFDHG